MKKQYKHLTLKERETIDILHRLRKSFTYIARELGVHKSTISREIKRYTFHHRDCYLASRADFASKYKKSFANQHERLKDPRIVEYVRDKLFENWSPELISGRIKIDLPGLSISYEAIYQYIYSIEKPWQRNELIGHLVRRHRARTRKFPDRKRNPSRIKNRISIEQRPKSAESREQPGHWEGDSLVSSESKVALNSLTERTTRLLFVTKMSQKCSRETSDVIIKRLKILPKNMRRTLTLDNGSENAEHERVTKNIGTLCFFAHPNSAFERGSNEHINGLIRRYLPKGTDFANISNEEIKYIETKINQRPRKCLGFRNPLETAFALGVAIHG
jgi:IS30 family transposase